MLKKITATAAILMGSNLVLEVSIYARSVYLNGQDITSARVQTLKKVNLKIDENGDIYIEAPHYHVNEETTYTPLSSYNKKLNAPKHGDAGPTSTTVLGTPGEAKVADPVISAPATQAPIENAPPKLQDKPGEKTGG